MGQLSDDLQEIDGLFDLPQRAWHEHHLTGSLRPGMGFYALTAAVCQGRCAAATC